MQCKELAGVLEQEGLGTLPGAARAHLAECFSCQSLLADLTSIVSVAHELPAEVEPPPRIWVSLRAQLEQEGIIKEPALAPAAESAAWWKAFSDLFRGRGLATAAVGLLIAGAAALQLQKPAVPPTVIHDPLIDSRVALNEEEHDLRNMHFASTSPVDASLRQNLQQVDDFIADCERRLREEPQDDLAREYLSGAYQQKAELLSAIMDRGGSVN